MENSILLENWVFYIGSVGLVIALVAYFILSRRKKPKSLGIEAQTFSEEGPEESNWWQALAKSRQKFSLLGQGQEISALKDSVEEACIVSDLGVGNTQELLKKLPWEEIAKSPEAERESQTKNQISQLISSWIEKAGSLESKNWPESTQRPFVIWFVGVNGVGKTTSIAKLAQELKTRGHSVLLAAGDTFRAAAGEQLETWAQRLEIPCVRGKEGADSSAVLFDALESAKAKGIDFVLCDSAGRLHNHKQLMENLEKNKRVMGKAMEGAPHEVLLVLDANTGQNMLSQSEQFLQSVGVTGLVLTKLDGSARGGAVVAVARKTKLPIRRLGLGESAKDFVPFDPESFSDALLGLNK